MNWGVGVHSLWTRYGRYATIQKARSTQVYVVLLTFVAVLVIAVATFVGQHIGAGFTEFGRALDTP